MSAASLQVKIYDLKKWRRSGSTRFNTRARSFRSYLSKFFDCSLVLFQHCFRPTFLTARIYAHLLFYKSKRMIWKIDEVLVRVSNFIESFRFYYSRLFDFRSYFFLLNCPSAVYLQVKIYDLKNWRRSGRKSSKERYLTVNYTAYVSLGS